MEGGGRDGRGGWRQTALMYVCWVGKRVEVLSSGTGAEDNIGRVLNTSDPPVLFGLAFMLGS